MNRILWMLGFKGSMETFSEAKQRTIIASEKLIKLSHTNNNIAVFAHGMSNRYIRLELIKQDWKLTSKDDSFWGVNILEK